jgi:L-cysteine:1D-myo-inositol 2-amino-2-deoxy-alpha-D-glucopyranoside ligase
MQSWYAAPPASIPGTPVPLRVWDSATRELRPVSPGETATMYVCGITPYDATHLGHAATYLTYDLIHRVLLDGGHRTAYVQNVTDIDDDILKRARGDRRGLGRARSPRDDAVPRRPRGAQRPAAHALPRRRRVDEVDRRPGRQAARRRSGVRRRRRRLLLDRVGGALRQRRRPRRRDDAGAVSGARRRPRPAGKKDPLDPLLWWAQRPGEPGWESPWGPGRPGWHVECAAIALSTLGAPIDIQGGGSDLAFPHHEMCSAEAEAATGRWPFARAYVHTGMVGLDGEKMSKSLGNLVFVRALRAEHDPAAIRLALLAHHYRHDWTWTDADMTAGLGRLERWRAAVSAPTAQPAEPVIESVRAALADDLDAPRALAAVDRWAAETTRVGGPAAAAGKQVKQAVNALLGVAL